MPFLLLFCENKKKGTRHKSDPLLRVRVKELKLLDNWVLVQTHARGVDASIPRSICFNISPFSYEKLDEEFLEQGQPHVQHTVEEWSHRYNLDVDGLFNVNRRILTALNMPIPHCLEVCAGNWKTWAIPLSANKYVFRNSGMHSLTPLLSHVDFGDMQRSAAGLAMDLIETDKVDLITPAGINMLQNTVRRLFAVQQSEELAKQIIWLQRRRSPVLPARRRQ